MQRSKILPAIFFAMPAAVVLTAQAGLSEPSAEACRTKPGPSTPHGMHWYYRINHADKQRHCWYLGAADARANSHAATLAPAIATQVPEPNAGLAQTQTAAVPQALPLVTTQPAPAQALFVAPVLSARGEPTNFAVRWPENLPSAQDVSGTEPPAASSSYAAETAETRAADAAQMPSQWSAPEAEQGQPGVVAEAALRYFSVAGGLAIPVLLLAGWFAKYARRAPRRYVFDQAAEIEAEAVRRADGVRTATPEAEPHCRPRTLTDPAHDLKTSLAELMRDLQRAGTASDAEPTAQPLDLSRTAARRRTLQAALS